LPPVHTPLAHVSVRVHALPSLQTVPSAAAGFEQTPLAVLQVPAAWHWSLAVHVTGFDPVQTPPMHASVRVHWLPSLHTVLSAAAGFEQTPLVVSHVPATWHWSFGEQTIGFDPVQAPLWHV
jgi:hypothetical protein